MTALGLGWRVRSWHAITVVAVMGPAESPGVVHRAQVTLLDDERAREPYHTAAAVPRDEATAFVDSVASAAAAASAEAIRGLVSSLGPVAAVGVVGADRRLPELGRIVAKHALMHAADRNLYEQAIVHGANRAGVPVTTIPATGKLLSDASAFLGVDLATAFAALGKTLGPPWQSDHKDAAAAALVALHHVRA